MGKPYIKFYLISIIVFIWAIIEGYFYFIASNAEKNYTHELLGKAFEKYEEIDNIGNLSTKTGKLYVKKNGEFVEVRPDLLMKSLFVKYERNREYYKLQERDDPQKHLDNYIYTIDKKKKRLKFFLNRIALDIDASYYLQRIDDIWLKFFLVSLLFTIFALIFIFLIYYFIKKSQTYKRLSNNLAKTVKKQTQKLTLALEGAELGYWHWNVQTKEHEVDERWLSMLGMQREELDDIQDDWESRIHSVDHKNIMPVIEQAIAQKTSYVVEFRMLHANGEYIWIQGSGSVTKIDEEGNALELSGTHQEITKRKTFELENKRNELYLQTLFEESPNIIIITVGKNIIQANKAFLNFFREYESLEEFKQEHDCICDFFCESEYKDTITSTEEQWVIDVLNSKKPIIKICYLEQEFYFSVYAKKIYEEKQIHIMVTFNDITQMYNIRHRFEDLSMQDPLTCIYNRRYFNAIYPKELNRAKRTHESFCFAIIDVDNFKLYNDNYGHDMGDEVLKKITVKITDLTQRSNEYFFRLGGEEFGIICSTYTKEETQKYFQNICKEIEDLKIEHLHNEWYDVITVSIGVCYLHDTTKGDKKLIYKSADDALYKAKSSGRNKVVLVQEC